MDDERDLILTLDLASIVGWSLWTLDGGLYDSGVWFVDGDQADRWESFRALLLRWLARYGGRLGGIAIERPITTGKVGRDWNSLRVLFGQSAIVELEASRRQLPTIMIPPSQIKKLVTGNGNARKETVVRCIEAQTGPLSIQPGGVNKSQRERADKARSDEADARGVGLVVLARYDRRALARREFVEVTHG